MSDAPADTATPEAPEASTDTPEAATAPDFSALAELNLTPEQIKGRVEASRKWEDRAKANADAAKELERIKREALPEQERLVAEAEARGDAAATARLAARIVDAEVKAAAAGRTVDVEALLEGLDRTRFVTPDGEPDIAAITAWMDRIAPPADPDEAGPVLDLGQGARGSASAGSDPLLADLKSALGIR